MSLAFLVGVTTAGLIVAGLQRQGRLLVLQAEFRTHLMHSCVPKYGVQISFDPGTMNLAFELTFYASQQLHKPQTKKAGHQLRRRYGRAVAHLLGGG